jgi:hypothetical protein
MLASWEISSFPKCQYHVFLSHCAEDRDWLVDPLYDRLSRLRIVAWFDRTHFGPGGDPHEKLRENILLSRHTVFLVTEGMLTQGRGWACVEKAYTGLLQENLRSRTTQLCRIELPLFFLPTSSVTFDRSVWSTVRSSGVYHGPGDGDPVEWAAAQVARFVYSETKRGRSLGADLEIDPTLIDGRPGLIDRVCATYPFLDAPPLPGQPN